MKPWLTCSPCWACADPAPENRTCPYCGAPPWTRTGGPDGVYVIRAECGLVKVGYSKVGVYARVHAIEKECGEPLEILSVLWGADTRVERWLQQVFADTRDRRAAEDHGLAFPTEWFWPTPALDRLAAGREHMRDGVLWEDPR